MTTKIQAIAYAIVSGIAGYIAYFLALPPSLQTGILGDLIAIAPPDWQPIMAGSAKTVSTIAGIYSTLRASQSGHPPVEPTGWRDNASGK